MLKALSTLTATGWKGLTTMHQGVVAANEQHGKLERQTGELTTTYTAAFERLDRSKRAPIELTSTILETDTGARGGFEELQRGLSETSERVEQGMDPESVVAETANLSKLTSDFVTAGSLAVSKIRGTTSKLSVEGTKENVSTAATPRRRTVVGPREAKEPSPPTQQPPPPPKLTEQPIMFGDLPTGPAPTLQPPSKSAAPPAKLTQMKKPRSVSWTTSRKPPSNGARKAAPLSEKPVNVVGTRGGLRRGVNGAGR